MVPLNKPGLGYFIGAVDRRPEAKGEEIVKRYQGWAEDESIFDELFECLRRNLKGQSSERVADGKGGYTYRVADDGMVQIAAARTLAQILRLMPAAGAGVTVNNSSQTINVTAQDRLDELDSIGVPRAEIAAACSDLLAATTGGQADHPGGDAGKA
jgi:hypothetical protein